MTPSRTRAWIVALAIFVFGVAVGGAGSAWVGLRYFRRLMVSPSTAPGFADRAAERIGADLTRSLELTPRESVQVQAVLDQTAGRVKQIRVDATRTAIVEFRRATLKIAVMLPPEKRAEFYEVIGKRYERIGLPAPQP